MFFIVPGVPMHGPEQDVPESGSLVLYHGSKVDHHGVWEVLCEHRGRAVLINPHDRSERLTLSQGCRTITVIVPNSEIVAAAEYCAEQISEYLES